MHDKLFGHLQIGLLQFGVLVVVLAQRRKDLVDRLLKVRLRLLALLLLLADARRALVLDGLHQFLLLAAHLLEFVPYGGLFFFRIVNMTTNIFRIYLKCTKYVLH